MHFTAKAVLLTPAELCSIASWMVARVQDELRHGEHSVIMFTTSVTALEYDKTPMELSSQ